MSEPSTAVRLADAFELAVRKGADDWHLKREALLRYVAALEAVADAARAHVGQCFSSHPSIKSMTDALEELERA